MSVFERHPKLTLAAFYLIFLLVLVSLAEVFLRLALPYDIGYYVGTRKEGKYEYPYGEIYLNSRGFPDTEFNLESNKKRIGYFGDSVTFGTGAGHGYRYSDLLEEHYSNFEHWTFGMVSNGVQDETLLKRAIEYKINTAVYALNMNDILPVFDNDTAPEKNFLNKFQRWVRANIDRWLRGRSYFYSWLRTSIKNTLTRFGYGHTGFKAAELFPKENEDLIQDVAKRVNLIGERLNQHNIIFCVLILPYEMQISPQAADIYKKLGIAWEDGFLDGSTQNLLKKYLKVPAYDGLNAFIKYEDKGPGTYFVYNKGDKIDFNHPNRQGHKVLADGFIQSNSCPGF